MMGLSFGKCISELHCLGDPKQFVERALNTVTNEMKVTCNVVCFLALLDMAMVAALSMHKIAGGNLTWHS